MMIVVAWLVTSVVMAAVLYAGAAAWERAAAWSGRSSRWAWLVALAGSVVLPWVLRLMPEPGWSEVMPAPMQLLTMDALTSGPVTAAGWSVQDVAVAVWLAMTMLALGYVGVTLLQLSRARRQWRTAELDGSRVLVAATTGPAAVGFRRAMVVVPAWVLELDAELRSLLLKHERAHVDAGDPRLLLAGLTLLAVMPWNPIVWIQLVRLRNAIELDCDARVLATGVDPRRYGSLLLEVGRRRSAHAVVMATFAEPRFFLEQRIRRIAQWPLKRHPIRAALFAAMALLLFAVAPSCDPVRIANISDLPPVPAIDGSDMLEAPSDTTAVPVFTPMTSPPELVNREEVMRALVRNYPPLLRDAGISGRPTVHFFIDRTGTVQRTLISKSSGYPALDGAALQVASIMKFKPAYNEDRTVDVWVEIPVVFSSSLSERDTVSSTTTRSAPTRTEPTTIREQSPLEAAGKPGTSETPVFTPMTDAPELLNADEVGAEMTKNYPPLLRDAGIAGSPTVHIYIGTDGIVQRVQLARSAGYAALDEAALRVAATMRFKAARNRGAEVPVWVEVPIVFRDQ